VTEQALETDAATVCLRFEVVDTGIGIAPAALADLFTPFTQAEAGITRRFGGTGLSLSISKRLVELMGGAIGVESRAGEGSTFWCELPFTRTTERAAAPRPAVPLPPSGPRLTGVRLLVVDDSAMNRDVVERALAVEGALATPAVDGQQAIQLLAARPAAFDAVLMDVRMPVMDGLTATRLIRTELGLSDLPIIACTAGVLSEEQAAARAAGVNAVLAKPLDLEQMVALLRQWVQPRPAAAGQDRQHLAVDGVGLVAETFPEIPGIDRARAAQTLGQDRAFFLRLLRGFADEFADAVAATRRDLARGEREAATRRLHTLRGNAGNLGAIDLMESVRGLEESLVRGASASDLEEGLAAFDGQLEAFLAASAPWRGAPTQTLAEPVPEPEPEPEPEPGDAAAPPLDLLQLAALREALSRNNAKARWLFRALEPSLRAALGAEVVPAVGQAISNFRFDTALAILDQAVLDQAGAGLPMPQDTGHAGDPGKNTQ
jgi:CheY-like chemotaxis protein